MIWIAPTEKDIAAQGWSLNPGRYVGAAPGEAVSDEDFKEQLETLNDELETLNAQEAGRYISLERLIEQNKERYYEVLEHSSARWHEGKHDPWPTMNFLLFILTQACKEFEQRVGQLKSPRGEKTEAVLAAVERQVSTFRVADLQAECPGVGVDLIRQILARLQKEMRVKSLGTGRGARWAKTGN